MPTANFVPEYLRQSEKSFARGGLALEQQPGKHWSPTLSQIFICCLLENSLPQSRWIGNLRVRHKQMYFQPAKPQNKPISLK